MMLYALRLRAPRPRAGAALFLAALALLALLLGATGPRAQSVDYIELLRSFSTSASAEPAPAMSRVAPPPPSEVAAPSAAAPAAPAAAVPAARAAEPAAYEALAAAARESDNMIVRTTQNVSVFRARLARILHAAPEAPALLAQTLARAAPDGRPAHFTGVFVVAVITLLIGRAVVSLYAAFIARPVMEAAQRRSHPVTLGDKIPVLALRGVLTVAAAAICVGVATALNLAVLDASAQSLRTAAVVLTAWAIYLAADTAWRMTLCPYLSAYRIPRLSDVDARRLYIWVSGVSALSVAGHGFGIWLDSMAAPVEVHALAQAFSSFLALLATLVMIWVNRRAISGAILGGLEREEASWISAACAMLWAPLATLYLMAAWVEEMVRLVLGLQQKIPLLAGAFLVLMAGMLVYAACVFTVEKLFARRRLRRGEAPRVVPVQAAAMEGDGDADGDGDEEGGPARAPRMAPVPLPPRRRRLISFEDLAQRAAAIFATGISLWLLARIWGGAAIFEEGAPLGFLRLITDKLFIGYVLFHAVRIWLDQRIEAEGGYEVEAEPGDEGGASSASRLATLLPLCRSFVLFVIIASTALSVAMELGVNVAPLFAGAGIVGLAIGFGAQALVKDILSGVFFLLDDAFRKGEYIDVGAVKGTVEKISIRSFQLRHHLGALHTIPFGEITHLTNFSRDWVMMKLPLRLTYDTDVERVRKLVKKLGLKLLEHPTEGPKFLQPLKSQGVIQMEDSAMIVRIKFMTRPGDQWTTRKLVYHEIRELFAREGIHFAHKEVTVRIPGLPEGRPLTEAEVEAAGAAVRRAVEDEDRAPSEDPALMR